jgi:hypothetical protein
MAGDTGMAGAVTVGPTGAAGPSGVTGARGVTGYTGAQGNTELAGVSGPMGATGAVGPGGASGSTGEQGPLAGGVGWSVYHVYSFDTYSDVIQRTDDRKAQEVAAYLNQNPSYRIGIDGLSERQSSSVRDALMSAGVPDFKIRTGSFGDPQLRRDGRVAVLVSSL